MIILNKKTRFFSTSCSKGNIVTILKIVLQVILAVWINERIYEVNGEELGAVIDEVLINVCLRCARTNLY